MIPGGYEPGTLMRLLPAIYRDSPTLTAWLTAFESSLLHRPVDRDPPALGDTIAGIPALVRPLGDGGAAPDRATPDDFLPWLAGWVGLGRRLVAILGQDLPSVDGERASSAADDGSGSRHGGMRLRRVIAHVVPLYASRGTREHLERVLRLCLPEIDEVRIDDSEVPGLTIGASRLGVDAWLVAYRPFHFRVAVRFAAVAGDREDVRRTRERALRRAAEAVIEWSKPAHTSYTATWRLADHPEQPARQLATPGEPSPDE